MLAEHEGITIGALERIIGASKGVLSRAISNGTDIQSKWLQVIVEYFPQYSARWLLTGEGDMMSAPPNGIPSHLVETAVIAGKNYIPPTTPIEDAENGEKKYLERIIAQAEEIGRLKERIERLEREKNDHPENYCSDSTL